MKEMWLEGGQKTAPYEVKKTLGQRVQRFAGFGQQDSAELVTYLVDLLHEDTNRVIDKPFKELSEAGGRPDSEIASEYWDAYKARN